MLIGRHKHEIEERSKLIRRASKFTEQKRESMFNAQSGLCALCTQPMSGWSGVESEVDHAIPVYIWAERTDITIEEATEQANDEKNLVLAHPDCNLLKHGVDSEEFTERISDGDLVANPKTFSADQIDEMKRKLSEQGRKGGLIQGRRNAESGHIQALKQGQKNKDSGFISALGKSGVGGRISGPISGRKAVESGQIYTLQTTEGSRKGALNQRREDKVRGGQIGGRKSAESGLLARLRTPDNLAKGGRAAGRLAVETGRIQKLGHTQGLITGRIYGPINGRKAVESGQLDSIRTSENCAKGGRIAGRISGRKAVESGQIQALGRKNAETGHMDRIRCARWHKIRSIIHPTCKGSWCVEQRSQELSQ